VIEKAKAHHGGAETGRTAEVERSEYFEIEKGNAFALIDPGMIVIEKDGETIGTN